MKLQRLPYLMFLLFCLFETENLTAQDLCWYPFLNFEGKYCDANLLIDTVSNPANIWQIGEPQKTIFDSAYSSPNVIITDRLESYPDNDTSSFIFISPSNGGFEHLHTAEIGGQYWVNSDTLKDYGIIEFSPDLGYTWIDLVNDTFYNEEIFWFGEEPTFTGNSYGWKSFHASIVLLGLHFEINFSDTILVRYTFISDSISNGFEGLMFDNLFVYDDYEGIETVGYDTFHSKAYPNPASISLLIEFDNPGNKSCQLTIYDSLGRQVFLMEDLSVNQVEINVQDYRPGIYYYKLLNKEEREGSWGKFLVE